MGIRLATGVGVLVLAIWLGSADVGASRTVCDPSCFGGGPGGVPTPLTQNQKVELADGESYLLVGWIRYLMDPATLVAKPYLEVDLDKMPWLASTRRKMHPFYTLELDEGSDWKSMDGRKVRVQAVAEGVIVHGTVPRTYEIRLLSSKPPETIPDSD